MPLMRLMIVAVAAAAGFGGFDACIAADSSSEVATIRKAGADYLKAIQEGNRAAVIAAWTADGDYVDASGRAVKVRELIQGEFRDERPGRAGERQTKTDQIRLLTPDVAVEDGTSEIRATPGELPVRTRHTAVWVKQDGRWLLSCLRESTLSEERCARLFRNWNGCLANSQVTRTMMP